MTTLYPSKSLAQRWLIIITTFLLSSLIFWNTSQSIIARWLKFDESYGHGFLLLGVVFWLFYELRNETQPANGQLNFKALSLLLPALFLWFTGKASGIIIFEQFSLPLLWWASIWFIGGWKLAKSVIFPVSFIYFAIPIWDHINFLLVDLSITVESLLLSITSMPILVEGNRFSIPSGVISIADGCSGLRYLIIGLAFGTLAARLYFNSMKMRISIVILSFILSLVANWLRIYILILIGYFTEMQSSLMNDHEMFGFWVFGFMLLPLFIFIRYCSEPLPKQSQELNSSLLIRPIFVGFILLSTLLISAPLGIHFLAKKANQNKLMFSGELSGEHLLRTPLPAEFFNTANNIKSNLYWMYQQEENKLYIQIKGYQQTQIGEDFIPYNKLINTSQWLMDKKTKQDGAIPYTEMQLSHPSKQSKWLVLYWYNIADFETNDKYKAKLAEIPAILRGRNDAHVIALFSQCPWQSCEDVKPKLNALLNNELALIKQLSGNK